MIDGAAAPHRLELLPDLIFEVAQHQAVIHHFALHRESGNRRQQGRVVDPCRRGVMVPDPIPGVATAILQRQPQHSRMHFRVPLRLGYIAVHAFVGGFVDKLHVVKQLIQRPTFLLLVLVLENLMAPNLLFLKIYPLVKV